jgi:ATP-dependent helicase/nuclease subunit A
MKGPNFAILASAGTGKTYQLSVRIARLLMADKVKPSEIIALTFTRAAAAEFYLRTLERLRDAATDKQKHLAICGDPASDGVDKDNPLTLDPKIHTQQKFAEKLKQLVLNADQLTLGTLDSFFARLVNQFALDLGLETSKPTTVSEQEAPALVEKAVKVLFDRLKNEGQLGALGVELNAYSDGKSMANPAAVLLEMAKANHELLTLAPQEQIWGNQETIWPQGVPSNLQLVGQATFHEADVAKVVKALEAYPLNKNRKDTYRQEAIKSFLKVTHLKKVSDADDKWLSGFLARYTPALKTEDKPFSVTHRGETVVFDPAATAAVRNILSVLFSWAVQSALRRTQALHACLTAFEQAYDKENRRKGLLSFSDYVTLLSQWPATIENESAEEHMKRIHDAITEIQFRLDSGLKHWLLDEFQDTGTRQYDVLSRNVDEVIQSTEGKSLFVVGDAKQSLYEWRSGNRKLLENLNRRIAANGISAELNQTRRCSPQVLQMVNELLHGLTERDLGKYFSVLAAKDWDKNYRTQIAHPEAPQQGQSLWVRIKSPLADEDPVGTQAKWIADDLAKSQLLEPAAGDKSRRLRDGVTCAILVSKNDDAAVIAEELRSLKIEATDEDSVSVIRDNPVTAGLFAILEATVHPDNGLACGLAWMSPTSRGLLANTEGKPAWGSKCREVAVKFAADGAEAVVDWLAGTVKLGPEDEFAAKRLRQFRSIAADYDQTGRRDLEDFIRFADGAQLRDSADSRSIQVLTIHRSKGLEYDLVYLPCLNDSYHKMAKARGNLLYQTPAMIAGENAHSFGNESTYDESLFRPNWLLAGMNSQIARHIEPLANAIEALEAEGAYGSLCKLYVGMTRAKYRLVMISNKLSDESESEFENPEKHGGHDFAKFLESSLRKMNPEKPCTSEVTSVYAWYNAPDVESYAWSKACLESHASKPHGMKSPQEEAVIPQFKAVIRPNKRPPSDPDEEQKQARWKKAGNGPKGKKFGTYVHELFALLDADIDEFRKALSRATPKTGEEAIHAEAMRRIEQCLKDPQIYDLLIHQAQGKKVWVERKAIIYKHESDFANPAVFDRVYIQPGKSALIIDYKTAGEETNQQLREDYLKQMTGYRETISKLTGISIENIHCKLIGLLKDRVTIVEVF